MPVISDLSGNGVVPNMGGMNLPSTSASSDYETVTASDSVALKAPSRMINVATEGDLTVMKPDGTLETLTDVSGDIPIVALQIMATGTDASGFTVYY